MTWQIWLTVGAFAVAADFGYFVIKGWPITGLAVAFWALAFVGGPLGLFVVLATIMVQEVGI